MSPQHTEVVDLIRQYLAALQELQAARGERQRLIDECKRTNTRPNLARFGANTDRLQVAQDVVAGLRAALVALGGGR